MKVALVNPPWNFEGSVYFGCPEPHLPLEYGYAAARLRANGHDANIFDAHLCGFGMLELVERVSQFEPEMVVVTSAPSYLFWRCAPPELRIPQHTLEALRRIGGVQVIVGPHASATPSATLRKTGAHIAVLGECEEVLARLADAEARNLSRIASIAYNSGNDVVVSGQPHAVDLDELPALQWDASLIHAHRHHHHRFDASPKGPGAEVETSRGCPFSCTFCAKENFRNRFRKRPLEKVLAELDGLLAAGVEYVYFIDEIFMPDRALLAALCERDLKFGVQMRIDHWDASLLELLGEAGCVSVEAGVESITVEGRAALAKKCSRTTEELTDLLVIAKKCIPFVQANLLGGLDRPQDVAAWREELREHGVWSNDPVPLFSYPGSPGYRLKWGNPDDLAWERAHDSYLSAFESFSDIQEQKPRRLPVLEQDERACSSSHASPLPTHPSAEPRQ